MSLLKSGIALLLVSVVLAACRSPDPLTEDEIPPDFLFTYEKTITPPAGTVTEEEPPPESEPAPEPTRVFLEIAFPGHVDYELDFAEPRPAKSGGALELTEPELRRIYDAVRAADLFGMKRRIVGEDAPGVRESFTVRGNLHFARIEVNDTHHPALSALLGSVKETLTGKEPGLFAPPKAERGTWILDRRNLTFHRADCPLVKDIPKEARILFHSVERCLDEGGEPCESCHPLERR